MPFARVGLVGGRPISRAELRERKKRINKRAASLEAIAAKGEKWESN